VLKENVVADGIDEGAEAFGLAQGAWLAEPGENPGKGLLAHVLDCVGGLEPRAKFQVEQFCEIPDKMLLGAEVPGTEVFDVSCIERMKLQSGPRQPERTQV
jgi:hypothetical protein